jgi:hypothetical protein
MEEKGLGIPVEDLAKERGGGHGVVERTHAKRTATEASLLGEGVWTSEDTTTSVGPLG